jgi:AMP-binding enzyme
MSRIVRPDGSTCGPGETGELLVKGPNVMAGYWKRPEATGSSNDAEGWLHTGDAARADAEDYIWIVDRVADRYLSSGQVVYPGDVERVLAQHLGVAEAGVVGVHGDSDQVGAAFVVLAAPGSVNEEELLDFCRQRLAGHEVPKSITFMEASSKLGRQAAATRAATALGELSRTRAPSLGASTAMIRPLFPAEDSNPGSEHHGREPPSRSQLLPGSGEKRSDRTAIQVAQSFAEDLGRDSIGGKMELDPPSAKTPLEQPGSRWP